MKRKFYQHIATLSYFILALSSSLPVHAANSRPIPKQSISAYTARGFTTPINSTASLINFMLPQLLTYNDYLNTPAPFSDEAFAAAVRDTLKLKASVSLLHKHLTKVKLLGILESPFNWLSMYSLHDLHLLPQLEGLVLSKQYFITDYSPLAKVKTLKHLAIANITYNVLGMEYSENSSAKTAILEILPKLTTLQDLDLLYTNIQDLSWAPALPQLKHLDLTAASVFDIAPLAQLSNLQELTLQENYIEDFSPIADLPIKDLGIVFNCEFYCTSSAQGDEHTLDLSFIANMTQLWTLDIRGSGYIDNIAPILTRHGALEAKGANFYLTYRNIQFSKDHMKQLKDAGVILVES